MLSHCSDIPQLSCWFDDQRFPLLFIQQNGKTRVWACWVINDTVFRTDGFINGKVKEPLSHTFEENAVKTAAEKAMAEAEKIWIKQASNGYKPDPNDTQGTEIWNFVMDQKSQNGGMNRGVKMFGDSQITVGTTSGAKDLSNNKLPMLAKKYKEDFELSSAGTQVKFPVLCQPKVDGMRVIAQVIDGQVILQSRNGNDFMHLNHIREEIKSFLSKHPDIILDGELYVHKLYKDKSGKPTLTKTDHEMKGVERYQFISESCKITRSNKHEFENFVEYWLFDVYDLKMTNKQRQEKLDSLFKGYKGTVLKKVPATVVNSHEEIEEYMSEMIGETKKRLGYEFEGVMIRELNAKYKSTKTHQNCLLKYKRFEDEEWQVIGAERCNGGAQDGSVKWICQKSINGKNKTVTAKPIGGMAEAKKLYQDYQKNPSKYKGKWLNIRFNEKSKDGVPRFPRAIAFVQDKF